MYSPDPTHARRAGSQTPSGGCPERAFAAFDFDGTLTRRDTLLDFLAHAFGRTRLLLELLRIAPSLVLMKLHLVDNGGTKRRLLSRYLRGRRLADVKAMAQRYCDERYGELMRPDTVAALEEHKRAGDTVVIVTASLSLWVEPFARRLGVDRLIATEAEVDAQGVLTGGFATPNCHGPEKVRRLAEAFPELAPGRKRPGCPRLEAYGDSAGDRELLALADIPHRV
ncbi:MAG: HAD-IB family hydrolase [Candidatus Amulumruptor caecigallinarius]|nr:HAD-IB family hydrolase [Candidatus Amulumruptor caecigallinarius]MCM1397146.1 HAD-IB family hydrolase [Candidatus Amulumruptor caecigallinarius]MCM1453165.1 HAD-IB family hydrolase [bacterium]